MKYYANIVTVKAITVGQLEDMILLYVMVTLYLFIGSIKCKILVIQVIVYHCYLFTLLLHSITFILNKNLLSLSWYNSYLSI